MSIPRIDIHTRKTRRARRPTCCFALLAIAVTVVGCHEVNDDRIPSMPVSINLSDPGVWAAYGVSGFGLSRDFIMQTVPTQPAGFHYSADSRTGFGGVLLIGGMDPFTADTSVVLAYDLSCPVERSPEVRVYVEPELYQAVCPECHSHYDVTMAGGAPVSGPAAQKGKQYGLRRYRCLSTGFGGYMVVN